MGETAGKLRRIFDRIGFDRQGGHLRGSVEVLRDDALVSCATSGPATRWVAIAVFLSALALGIGLPAVAAEERAGEGAPIDQENATNLLGGEPVEKLETIHDLARTPDGGLLAVKETAKGSDDLESTILRLDADGNVQNRATVPGVLRGVARVGEDRYAASGARDGDVLLAWIRPDGTVEWTETYGGEGRDVAPDVASAPDGDAYVVGSTKSFGAETTDLWILRVGADGSAVWDRRFEHEIPVAVSAGERLRDGSLIATASSQGSTNGETDARLRTAVARLAPDGTVRWRSVFGGADVPDDVVTHDVVPAHSEGVLLVGATRADGESAGSYAFWTSQVAPDGSTVWQSQYEGPTPQMASSAVRTADGYLLAGFAKGEDAGVTGKLVAVDAGGTERTTRTYGRVSDLDDRILAVEWTTAGRLAIGGRTVNSRDEGTMSLAWIVDVSAAFERLPPGPSAWETQHEGMDGSAEGGGNTGGNGGVDTTGTESTTTPPTDSSMDLVLYVATALSVGALFVPYGLRRFWRR